MVAARKKRMGMVLESYENWMPIANAHLGYLRVVRAIKTIPATLMLAHAPVQKNCTTLHDAEAA